jgi:hypothetical protein
MAVRILAKDSFPLFAVASWASRAEAHETITAACEREARRSGFSLLLRELGTAANGNERRLPQASLPSPLSRGRNLVTEFSRRRG